MKIRISGTNITASIAPLGVDRELEAAGRVFYVYVHKDKTGHVFYVGKGRGRRAWSTARHSVWHQYVNTRLLGQYDVEIVRDALLNSEAETLEAELVNQYGERLVNWHNTRRLFDYDALDRYWALRRANELWIAETATSERTDLPLAIARYRQAMERLQEYEGIELERGLVAQLSAEISSTAGNNGLLDRLTLCLCKLGRVAEASAEVERYLARFPGRRDQRVVKGVLRRIDRANTKRTSRRSAGNDVVPVAPIVSNMSGGLPRSAATPTPEEQDVLDADYPTGLYRGRHFTTYGVDLDALQQARRDDEFETLLVALLGVVEAEARANGWGVAPAYYKRLAVFYRKVKRYDDEVRVLERYAAQPHAPGALVPELIARLHKARALRSRHGKAS